MTYDEAVNLARTIDEYAEVHITESIDGKQYYVVYLSYEAEGEF